MRLLRFAVVTFSPQPTPLTNWEAKIGSVRISTRPAKLATDQPAVLVAAESTVQPHQLETLPDAKLAIVDEARRTLEHAIETSVDLVAVSLFAARNILSPTPCVALVADDAAEEEQLRNASALVPSQPYGTPSMASGPELAPGWVSLMRDRPEGVKLLAEGLAHQHPTGRFHEFVRVFERAFAASSKHLVPPLARFLSGTFLSFSETEVRTWINDIRHRSIHADGKIQTSMAFDSDVRPVLGRVQLAAYDVLFNKANWHDQTDARRDVWTPVCGGLGGSGGDVFLTQGQDASLTFQVLDPFGAFPLEFGAVWTEIPHEWWIGGQPMAGAAPSEMIRGRMFVLPPNASLLTTVLGQPTP